MRAVRCGSAEFDWPRARRSRRVACVLDRAGRRSAMGERREEGEENHKLCRLNKARKGLGHPALSTQRPTPRSAPLRLERFPERLTSGFPFIGEYDSSFLRKEASMDGKAVFGGLRRRAVGTIELASASGQHETSVALKVSRTGEPSSDALRSICEAIRAYQAKATSSLSRRRLTASNENSLGVHSVGRCSWSGEKSLQSNVFLRFAASMHQIV